MLDDRKFWERVKKLEGKPIFTLTRHKPSKVMMVDEKKVIIENRVTPVYFGGDWGLYENYHRLHSDGRLLIHDTRGSAPGPYIAMAIILAVVPDEAMRGDEGIRLK